MMKNPKITCKSHTNDFFIFINDIEHIHIIKEHYRGRQSFYRGTNKNRLYCIEVYQKDVEPILFEYGDFELWKEIIKLFTENF